MCRTFKRAFHAVSNVTLCRSSSEMKCSRSAYSLIAIWQRNTSQQSDNPLLCTADDGVFPAFMLTVAPSYLQMSTSAARELEGVTMSATTLWAVTAAPVTKATCWLDATCVMVGHNTKTTLSQSVQTISLLLQTIQICVYAVKVVEMLSIKLKGLSFILTIC